MEKGAKFFYFAQTYFFQMNPIDYIVTAFVSQYGVGGTLFAWKLFEKELLAFTGDKLKSIPRPLSREPHIQKAREKTIDSFAKLGKNQVSNLLIRWHESDAFEGQLKTFLSAPEKQSIELCASRFSTLASEHGFSADLVDNSAQIVIKFFEELHSAVLSSSKLGPGYHDALEQYRAAETNELINESTASVLDSVSRLGDQIALSHAERSTNNLVVTNLFGQLEQKDATIEAQRERIEQLEKIVTPEAPADSNSKDSTWSSAVDVAVTWSDTDDAIKLQGARNLVSEIRCSLEFADLSQPFLARLATVEGRCALAMGDTETAIGELKSALKLNPENIHCLSNAASASLLEGDFVRAGELAELVRGQDHLHLNASMILLQSWFENGHIERIDDFLSTESWFLNTDEGCAAAARVLGRQGRYSESIELCKKALKINRKLWACIGSSLRLVVLAR